MAELVAQGQRSSDRWRRKVAENQTFILGRTAQGWATPWDSRISRSHVELILRAGKLHVKKIATARNPIFFNGNQQTEFTIKAGEHFVIGETSFSFSDESVEVTMDSPSPMTEQAYQPQFLRQVRYRNADKRIAVLSQLPEIISSAASTNELLGHLVNLLLAGIARASAVAIVTYSDTNDEESKGDVKILHWDRRKLGGDQRFQPSASLIRQSVKTEQSIVHIWRDQKVDSMFTMNDEGDWAFSTPIIGRETEGWAIYVTGVYSNPTDSGSESAQEDLRDEVKFTELVGSTLANLKRMRTLEKTQASLGHFFSPVVLQAIQGQDPEEVLKPRMASLSILFCDLRGFSRASEEAEDLLALLNRVSQALGITTHQILDNAGVVGDFHGDAAMGFWGWPLAQNDACERACIAALNTRQALDKLGKDPSHPLHGYKMGLGIATGEAVAGKIGTVDQVKVTAFGPVVNLASRLEGMTKHLKARILIDETTANQIRANTDRKVARVRRVARIRPFGISSPLEVSELLPPVEQFPLLSDDHIEQYENALDSLYDGDWNKALQLLHNVPSEDEVKDFLTFYIVKHNRIAPPDWDGVIPLDAK